MRAYNETLYDKDTIIRYNKHFLVDFFKRNFIIVAVGALAAAIYCLVVAMYGYMLMIVGMTVFYAILTIVIQKTSMNRALKRSPIVANPIIRTYLFEDDEITIGGRYVKPHVLAEGETGPSQRTLKYDQIVKIEAKAEFLMIYDTDRRIYLVNLTSFENPAQHAPIKAFLAEKIGKRYR